MKQEQHIETLLSEIADLKVRLFEANGIIDAIKDGSIDALVLNKNGTPNVYSLESADYTYRILIEKFGEGALSISEEGLILYCNDYFAGLIGLPSTKIIGSYFNSYIASVWEFTDLMSALKNGPSKGEIMLRYEGKKRPVYISLTNLQPTVSAIGIIVTDLSQKKKHEEALALYQRQLEVKVNELNQTNTNLEQFIHVVSHDLKEPLRKIVSYTSHLNSTRADLFTKHEVNNLNIINSSALRLNSLVDDLVKYAFSTNKVEDDEVDLTGVLREVMDDLELVITERAAVIRSDKLPVITGSRVQMRQLFSNLISNAIKYGKRDVKPEITITTGFVENIERQRPDKNFYKISLHDNGIGMDKAHLSKIFTIFQRLHMRNEYSGNGIGLAICKKIMENHAGKIDVESAPNEGSTFNLYFPSQGNT